VKSPKSNRRQIRQVATLRQTQASERAEHHDQPKGLRDGAIIAPAARLCPAPVRGGGAHRWARFGRIHAGGDGRRARTLNASHLSV